MHLRRAVRTERKDEFAFTTFNNGIHFVKVMLRKDDTYVATCNEKDKYLLGQDVRCLVAINKNKFATSVANSYKILFVNRSKKTISSLVID